MYLGEKMFNQQMAQPTFYMFKCEVPKNPNFPKPACVSNENRDLFQYLASKIMQKGVMGTVQPVQSGCLNRCSLGPVMLVEPGHFMYVGLTKEKIDKIVDEHIIGGTPIEEYLIPKGAWGEPLSIEQALKMAGR